MLGFLVFLSWNSLRGKGIHQAAGGSTELFSSYAIICTAWEFCHWSCPGSWESHSRPSALSPSSVSNASYYQEVLERGSGSCALGINTFSCSWKQLLPAIHLRPSPPKGMCHCNNLTPSKTTQAVTVFKKPNLCYSWNKILKKSITLVSYKWEK